MRDIWVTSDTHFGHANIIDYCGRPFHGVHHMNEMMIHNWNVLVKDGDIVWHLGDVYMGVISNRLPLVLRDRKGLCLETMTMAKIKPF